jgi:hypothetical protein
MRKVIVILAVSLLASGRTLFSMDSELRREVSAFWNCLTESHLHRGEN